MKRTEHKTERLIIRPLKMTDYQTWYDAQVNGLPQQSKWDRGPYPAQECTLKIFKNINQEYIDLAKKDDYYRYSVFEKKSGILVGLVDFNIYDRGNLQFANYGYRIYNRHWGQGYGLEAALAGLKIGVKELKLNRLEAAINLDNKKSIKMVKAIGMKKEGIRKKFWYEDGKWVDHLIYVATPQDIGMKSSKPFKK
jgi:[ribosomal protein S5]-alanine N-acetyltransferase